MEKGGLLNKILQECLIDCSTDTEIAFKACCEECNKTQFAFRKRFSKAGITPETQEKMTIYRILYRREWEKLRDEAEKKLNERFNICPICKKIVCDNCFLICDEIDMCVSCAKALKEDGISVAEL